MFIIFLIRLLLWTGIPAIERRDGETRPKTWIRTPQRPKAKIGRYPAGFP